MGVHSKFSGGPRRAYYPSGPWIDGIRPTESTPTKKVTITLNGKEVPSTEVPTGNPDPLNYQIVSADEIGEYLILKIKYPNCTNYEGEKILVYKGINLIQLVNQKVIDPHFFKGVKYASPVARFVPSAEGWKMAHVFVMAMKEGVNDKRQKS